MVFFLYVLIILFGVCYVNVEFWYVLCDCRVYFKFYVEFKDSDGRLDEEVVYEVYLN